MKVINLEQGSDEWLAWRKTKITASELAIIIGKSKWSTPFKLWQEKLGFAKPKYSNYAMTRGLSLEPMIREKINSTLGTKFVPAVVQHDLLDFAGASLDGIDTNIQAILEIKCSGAADHAVALKDKVPDHYYPQIQWQLFCSGFDLCYYASYSMLDELHIFEVERDDTYINEILIPAAAEFHDRLMNLEEPDRSEDDFVLITDADFEIYANEYKHISKEFKSITSRERFLKAKLISYTDDSNCYGCGIKLARVNRKGSIDWAKLWEEVTDRFPEVEKEFSQENYRADQIGYFKISIDKED